ncbi:MAG: phage antirepressor N-terminal domain-containing protein [Oscillospiraceae bacterium]
MNQEIKKIKFGEDELLGVKTDDGQVWLAVRKVCLDIGLTDKQTQRQVANIQDDLVLSKGYSNLGILTNGGKQNMVVIKEDFVTLWLAKISLTPAMQEKTPKAVEKLVAYQLKAQKVLHEAFTSTEEKKQDFYSTLGIEGKIEELSSEMAGLTEQVTLLIDSATINSRQAQKLLEVARYRVKSLLGNVDSIEYKKNARKYFKRMWNNFAEFFETNTYKDLNPLNMDSAIEYLHQWNFIGA